MIDEIEKKVNSSLEFTIKFFYTILFFVNPIGLAKKIKTKDKNLIQPNTFLSFISFVTTRLLKISFVVFWAHANSCNKDKNKIEPTIIKAKEINIEDLVTIPSFEDFIYIALFFILFTYILSKAFTVLFKKLSIRFETDVSSLITYYNAYYLLIVCILFYISENKYIPNKFNDFFKYLNIDLSIIVLYSFTILLFYNLVSLNAKGKISNYYKVIIIPLCIGIVHLNYFIFSESFNLYFEKKGSEVEKEFVIYKNRNLIDGILIKYDDSLKFVELAITNNSNEKLLILSNNRENSLYKNDSSLIGRYHLPSNKIILEPGIMIFIKLYPKCYNPYYSSYTLDNFVYAFNAYNIEKGTVQQIFANIESI